MSISGYKLKPRGMTGGWKPVGDQPVLGGPLGTCFDCHVMREDGIYKIWFPAARPVHRLCGKPGRNSLGQSESRPDRRDRFRLGGARGKPPYHCKEGRPLSHVVHRTDVCEGNQSRKKLYRLCGQRGWDSLEAQRKTRDGAAPCLGENNGDVPSRTLGGRAAVLPYVVLRRKNA